MEHLKFKMLLGDKVLVKPNPKVEKTRSDLYIPEIAQSKPNQGTIVQVGEGTYALSTGVFMPTTVKRGQEVLYPVHAGTEINLDGETFLLLREGDLWGVL